MLISAPSFIKGCALEKTERLVNTISIRPLVKPEQAFEFWNALRKHFSSCNLVKMQWDEKSATYEIQFANIPANHPTFRSLLPENGCLVAKLRNGRIVFKKAGMFVR